MRILFLFLIAISFSGCRKDKCEYFRDEKFSYDKILPHAYFPAYPGSYWVFNNSSSDSITVDPNWMPFKVIEHTFNSRCERFVTDWVMLPKIESEYLNYDRLHANVNSEYNSTNILFSDEMSWKSYNDPEFLYPSEPNMFYQFPDKYRYKRKRIDFLQEVTLNSMVFDSVLVIQEDQYLTGGVHDNFLLYTNIYYYAKDVGPIRIEKYETDQGQSPPSYIYNITDYFINN